MVKHIAKTLQYTQVNLKKAPKARFTRNYIKTRLLLTTKCIHIFILFYTNGNKVLDKSRYLSTLSVFIEIVA